MCWDNVSCMTVECAIFLSPAKCSSALPAKAPFGHSRKTHSSTRCTKLCCRICSPQPHNDHTGRMSKGCSVPENKLWTILYYTASSSSVKVKLLLKNYQDIHTAMSVILSMCLTLTESKCHTLLLNSPFIIRARQISTIYHSPLCLIQAHKGLIGQ